MHAPPVRSAPYGAYLAIAGAAIAVGSLVLPWFTLDSAGLTKVLTELFSRLGTPQGVDTTTMVTQSVQELKERAEPQLVGYRDSIGWVVTRVLIAAGVIVAALKVLGGDESGTSQRTVFLGGALAFALRPVIYLVAPPSDADLQRFGIDFAEVTNPATGLYVAILGSVLLVGAGLLAHVGDEEPAWAPDSADAPSAAHVHVPAAYLPKAPAAVAAAQAPVGAACAYVPAGAPTPVAPPRPYVPPGPPMPPGPRQPQPAPRPQAAPAMFATSAQAMPGPQPAPPARAQGSVAPPGF